MIVTGKTDISYSKITGRHLKSQFLYKTPCVNKEIKKDIQYGRRLYVKIR